MGLLSWADDVVDGAEQAWRGVGEMFDPVLRIGVTGLSGAGKTVFITALVTSLLRRGRMRLLSAEAEGRIQAAALRPQPDLDVPRFGLEDHVAALTASTPVWPESTRQISQLRLSLKVRPKGMLSGLTGPRQLNIDIVDYPGEWLLDLPLLDKDYERWAAEALAAAGSPARAAHGAAYLAVADLDPAQPHDEPVAARLADAFRGYLMACRKGGLSALAPGRFLMPGDMEGSPALTFAPLSKPGRAGRGSLYRQMADRFEAYKSHVVKPFYKNHFARLDRQVVLIDALGALAQGPRALGDLTQAMAETLKSFKHGDTGWLEWMLGGRRIDRLLFVASKADHLHSEQHAALTNLTEAMVAEAQRQAAYRGADTKAMALASIRATSEQLAPHGGHEIGVVRGRRMADGKEVALYPGALPTDVAAILADASATEPGHAPETWDSTAFARPAFAPPAWEAGPNDGPPHIRLDRALEFLIGDKLA